MLGTRVARQWEVVGLSEHSNLLKSIGLASGSVAGHQFIYLFFLIKVVGINTLLFDEECGED